MKHNQYDEAKQILLDAAKHNDRLLKIPKNFDELLHLQMNTLKAEQPAAAWKEIWENKRACLNLGCVHLSQALSISLNYTILLNVRVYGRELLYVNTVIAGVFEIIGILAGFCFMTRTQHKWQWTGLLNVVGGVLLLTEWVYTFDGTLVYPICDITLFTLASSHHLTDDSDVKSKAT